MRILLTLLIVAIGLGSASAQNEYLEFSSYAEWRAEYRAVMQGDEACNTGCLWPLEELEQVMPREGADGHFSTAQHRWEGTWYGRAVGWRSSDPDWTFRPDDGPSLGRRWKSPIRLQIVSSNLDTVRIWFDDNNWYENGYYLEGTGIYYPHEGPDNLPNRHPRDDYWEADLSDETNQVGFFEGEYFDGGLVIVNGKFVVSGDGTPSYVFGTFHGNGHAGTFTAER